jgi:uncharacterized membrane protein YccC
MDKETKLKEAFKVALAFALVYGIALKLNWMQPSWAGWGVIATAASSVGQSFQKGLFRIFGTLLACFSGISVIALASHNRWTFAIMVSVVIFIYAYIMQADKSRNYFWFVVAYVFLVITAVGPSPIGAFKISVYRTIETAMGIGVYTLIAVFLWPISNIGDIKKASIDFLQTQILLLQSAYEQLKGSDQSKIQEELSLLETKQMGQFSLSLNAEGTESYQVKEFRSLWDQFEKLSFSLVQTKNRLFSGIEDLSGIDITALLPDFEIFFNEIEERFSETKSILQGNAPLKTIENIKVTVDSEVVAGYSNLDKSALAIIINELNKIEITSRNLLILAKKISGFEVEDAIISAKESKSKFSYYVFDIDQLIRAIYVSLVTFFGFVIWFYINPAGHSAWYIVGGIFALISINSPQLKMIALIIPLLIAMTIFSGIYIFILPHLTRFYELGILLFVCMFAIRYFLKVGILLFTLVFIELVTITNPQKIDIPSLFNGFVYTPMLLVYLYVMSIIISSPMPEKAFLKSIKRFLKSVDYLLTKQALDSEKPRSFFENYKTAFHLQELKTLPDKSKAWGKAIDISLFPNTSKEEILEMTAALQTLAVKLDALIDAKSNLGKNELTDSLIDTVMNWKQELDKTFDNWNNSNETIRNNNSQSIKNSIKSIEENLVNSVFQNKNSMNEEDGIKFYNLLGCFKGVTDATLLFSNAADKVDWRQYNEERFQ